MIKDFEYFLLLLEPGFVELDGLVLFSGHIAKEDYEQNWRIKALEDKQKTERTINHVHLEDVVSDAEHQHRLGKVLMRIWMHKLKEQFPGRDFEVALSGPLVNGWQLDVASK